MLGMRRKHLSWLAVAACVVALPGFLVAQEISVSATVDRKHVTVEDQVVLQVTVQGPIQNVDEPERPPLGDFEVYFRGRGQSLQIINGKMDASYTFTYVLLPKREGNLVIGPFSIKHGSTTYSSEPVSLRVGGTPPDAVQDSEIAERDLYVVARVDKNTVYVNEQVIYTFSLYAATRVSNLNYTAPGFEGFWVEKLQEGEKQFQKIINGRRYLVIEVDTAVFPTTSGKLSIDPGRLRLVELSERSFRSFFDQGVEKVLRSRPLEIEVLSLPAQGRPRDFDGAVGESLSISAKLDRAEVAEGEPAVLQIQVNGIGNVRTFSKPRLPELPQFKTYDSDSKTTVHAMERVEGTRSYEVVLVPTAPGDYTLPPVRLSYFDTREARYRTVETKPFQLTAVRTAESERLAAEGSVRRPQDIEVVGEDIAHIRTDVPIADRRTPLYRATPMLVALPLPLLAILAVWIGQRRRERFASDVALARSTRARKMARKRLSLAAKLLAAEKGTEFYGEVARALQQYVGDKLNVSATGLTHEALREQLRQAAVSEDHRERLVQVLEQCDAARFAPGGMSKASMQDVLQEVELLLAQLDGRIGRRNGAAKRATHALFLVVCLGLAAGSVPRTEAQDEPVTVQTEGEDFLGPAAAVERANTAYEAGEFAKAVRLYERAESLGVRNGQLYFNLGNAHFKNGDLGLAVVNYRRAERLLPRDELVQQNLAYALSRREDKAMQPEMPWILAWVAWLYRWLNLNEWFLLTVGLYFLTSVLVVVRIVKRGAPRATHVALVTCIVLLLLSGAALAAKVAAEHVRERGVVTVPKTSVMSGPGKDYTVEFSLREGTEVEIEVTRPDWLRIVVNRNLRGWIPALSVEAL